MFSFIASFGFENNIRVFYLVQFLFVSNIDFIKPKERVLVYLGNSYSKMNRINKPGKNLEEKM